MNNEQTPNPKCSGCKCYWKPDETDIKSSGLPFRTCRKCRDIQQEFQDKKKAYKKEKVLCDCGMYYTRNYLFSHLRNKVHRPNEPSNDP